MEDKFSINFNKGFNDRLLGYFMTEYVPSGQFKDWETVFLLPYGEYYDGVWEIKNGSLNAYISQNSENPNEAVFTAVHEIVEADVNKVMSRLGYPCHIERSGDKTSKFRVKYNAGKWFGEELVLDTCLCHFITSVSEFNFQNEDWRKSVGFYLHNFFPLEH